MKAGVFHRAVVTGTLLAGSGLGAWVGYSDYNNTPTSKEAAAAATGEVAAKEEAEQAASRLDAVKADISRRAVRGGDCLSLLIPYAGEADYQDAFFGDVGSFSCVSKSGEDDDDDRGDTYRAFRKAAAALEAADESADGASARVGDIRNDRDETLPYLIILNGLGGLFCGIGAVAVGTVLIKGSEQQGPEERPDEPTAV